jgi:hypothetical protein
MYTIYYSMRQGWKAHCVETDNLEGARIAWDTLKSAGIYMISARP